MKKFLKIGAVLTALVLGLVCFVACSNDDGGDSRSVVAEYQAESPHTYIFYSDETYECKEGQKIIVEKGLYYGSPTRNRASVTMQRQYSYDSTAGKLISDIGNYSITISREGDELYFEDEYGEIYFLTN